jgi:phage gp36-like protein
MAALTQPQYAQESDLTSLALTPAAAARFGSIAINAQLQAASSLVDSYIASQFTLPLQVSPQGWDMSLTRSVCIIAAYLLYVQYGFNPSAPADQFIFERYKSEILWLEQIRDKEIFPQWIDSGTTPLGQDEGGAWVVSDPPVGFTGRGISSASNWTPDAGE